jgi:hypothetical protein
MASDETTPAAVPWPKALLKVGLDVLMISVGVFIGLMGDQWRDDAQHRELARESLRRFRGEVATNRQAVERVREYHVTTQAGLRRYFATDPKARRTVDVQVHGLQPAFFERTAWDRARAR